MAFDGYDTPDAEALLELAARRRIGSAGRRQLLTELAAAAVVLSAAAVLAALAPESRALSASTLIVSLLALLVATSVRFPVAAGWTRPTQVVFVPILFMLPLTLVPLVVIACLLAEATPRFVRGDLSVTSMVSLIGDGAYALGPVAVLLAFHEQAFAWAQWPVYLLALVAQVGLDLSYGLGRMWFADRVLPSEQTQMAWVYMTDAALSCVGLLIAGATVGRPALVFLAVPLIGLLGLFARERQQRMDHTLALSTAYRGTALLLGDVIEDDDEYTGVHSRAVVDLALAVSDRLRLDAGTRRNVEFGALLHDVGKIRVPKAIIHKQGTLTEEEWVVMRNHTVFGEQMLRQVGGTLSSVGRVVRHSHERYDGTGYPDRLAGEEIPIESRVISACDAFNAMTTNRPYRRAMSLEGAIEELRRCTGSHFDPRIVQALLDELAGQQALRQPGGLAATHRNQSQPGAAIEHIVSAQRALAFDRGDQFDPQHV
jgi:putative nucleotidyltransferase with HDIG domain